MLVELANTGDIFYRLGNENSRDDNDNEDWKDGGMSIHRYCNTSPALLSMPLKSVSFGAERNGIYYSASFCVSAHSKKAYTGLSSSLERRFKGEWVSADMDGCGYFVNSESKSPLICVHFNEDDEGENQAV